ncbi:hypothetical protein NDU88_003905 [Pleurodeles waltl]|uniref:Uncharacterized protein n=1 Tax=Pleurodeles waltl TaxID=8319 RepID=A0AAV7LH22_PLEWA|nr:hypothetical protein NDU88_003905 [Pleurodeles waltl]
MPTPLGEGPPAGGGGPAGAETCRAESVGLEVRGGSVGSELSQSLVELQRERWCRKGTSSEPRIIRACRDLGPAEGVLERSAPRQGCEGAAGLKVLGTAVL